MDMEHKVVAHFLTKEIKKGTAYDFTSDAPMMHLLLLDDAGKRQVDRINLDLIKAIFFVRDHEGNNLYKEKNEFETGKTVYGKKLSVEFHDGEKIVGYSVNNPSQKKRFVMIPADPNGNNLKILINTDTIKDLAYL
jgi:hypothetical protein